MTKPEYPQRQKFFAYRLTRMMFKTALANEIGPEACHLIIQIAHTEDAARYARAVTFYNEQLLPVCGFTNVKALDRARAKAVKSGWLVYLPGGKGKAGKYWTQIPEQYLHFDDTPIDESDVESEINADTQDITFLPATGKETGEKRETNGREAGDKRELNARETPEKWATITSIPNPSPIPNSLFSSEVDLPPSKLVNAKAEKVRPNPPVDAVMTFDCVGRIAAWYLTRSQVASWQELFPAVDITQECRSALAWLMADTKRRKTASGMPRFLVGWFGRSTNRSRASPGIVSPAQTIPDPIMFDESDFEDLGK